MGNIPWHPVAPFNIYIYISTIWLFNIAMENPLLMEVLMGNSSVFGPFSIAMFNNQRVYIYDLPIYET